MGYKYEVLAAKYPFNGLWERTKQFNTLRQATRYIRKCQRQGYLIVNLFCRDLKNNDKNKR